MSLEEKLAGIQEMAAGRIPAEDLKVMAAEVVKVRESGIQKEMIQVGDVLPPFALKDANGAVTKSADLLADGGIVLTVFRGHW